MVNLTNFNLLLRDCSVVGLLSLDIMESLSLLSLDWSFVINGQVPRQFLSEVVYGHYRRQEGLRVQRFDGEVDKEKGVSEADTFSENTMKQIFFRGAGVFHSDSMLNNTDT